MFLVIVNKELFYVIINPNLFLLRAQLGRGSFLDEFVGGVERAYDVYSSQNN